MIVLVATAAVVSAVALALSPRDVAPPMTSQPPAQPPASLDDPVEEELLRKLSQAEGLLRLGKADAAAALARELPARGPHAFAALRVRCWAHFLAGENADVAALLTADRLSSELAFLRGAAYWRSGLRQRGLTELRGLWWGEPDGVWGLAAARELATVGESRPVYGEQEVTAILATVPPVGVGAARRAEDDSLRTLEALRAASPPRGLLAAEVEYAIGVHKLRAEKFTEAIGVLRRALEQTRNPELRRATELRLGQAERRRGGYAAAQSHFARVAAGADDRFADEALALAGQMAIEYRRYPEARCHFQAQLVRNPVGPTRQVALWGLGWIAFRTGDFGSARRFFETLISEAPYGPLAPRALYWGARVLEERGRRREAAAEMAALEQRFPVDYYAFRARAWRGSDPAAEPAPLPAPGLDRRVGHVRGLVESGMTRRARRALRQLSKQTRAMGPADLRALAEIARTAGAHESARVLGRALERRFPDGIEAAEALAALFPPAYVRMLAIEARAQRIDPDLPPALVRQESGFRARAVSAVGALGLMQLMPSTARGLLREERRNTTVTTERILEPRTNVRLGVRYLGRMLRAFNRRVEYALAAYNAGPGAVTRWRQAHGDLPVDIFVEEIPYRETRHYTRRVLAAHQTLHFIRATREAALVQAETARAIERALAGSDAHDSHLADATTKRAAD